MGLSKPCYWTAPRLLLNDKHPYVIRRIGRYTSFEEMLAHEDAKAIAPDLHPDELLAALHALYPAEKAALGAFALEISPLKSESID